MKSTSVFTLEDKKKMTRPKRLSGSLALMVRAAAVALWGVGVLGVSQSQEYDSHQTQQQGSTQGALLLQNGDFEAGELAPWKLDSWQPSASADPVQSPVYAGKRSARLTCLQANDARLIQSVSVHPNSFYRLSAWVKTENVGRDALGANLCQYGTWAHSKDLQGTSDWTRLSMFIFPTGQSEMTIGCRLGFWGSTNSGTVWFDDVRLTQIPSLTLRVTEPKDRGRTAEFASAPPEAFGVVEGRHVTLRVQARKLATLRNPLGWVEKLDAAYEAYADLVGFTPYAGKPIAIQEVEAYPGGWAVAGNPILWHGIYVEDSFRQVNQGDWLFGILHELGHDFDHDAWNWHGEFFANLKMAYAAEQTRATIVQGGKVYDYARQDGPRLVDYYGDSARRENESRRMKQWLPHNDPATYHFLMLVERIGWGPFKKAFRALKNVAPEQVPRDAEGKLNLFVKTLSQTAGEDLVPWFAERGFPVK